MSDTLIRKLERKALTTEDASDIIAYWKACIRADEIPTPISASVVSSSRVWTLYPKAYRRSSYLTMPPNLIEDPRAFRFLRGIGNPGHTELVNEILPSLEYLIEIHEKGWVRENPSRPRRVNGDDLLRKLERDNDLTRLELEKHRRGMPSKICMTCEARLAANSITSYGCECCLADQQDAFISSTDYGYAPSHIGFLKTFYGYPMMYCVKHSAAASGWRNVTGRRSLQHHYSFIDAKGRYWFGKGAGGGMYLQVHMSKRKARPNCEEAQVTREAQEKWRIEHGC